MLPEHCAAAVAGVSHQASCCQAPYMQSLHQACNILKRAEKSTPYVFKGLQMLMKYTKSLHNNLFPKAIDVNIQRDNFQKETDCKSLAQAT